MGPRTLFVSDLDGTLLGPDALLSDFTRRALRSLIADGMLFTVATARMARSIRALLGDIALPLPVIELNGAYVSDQASGRHLVVQSLDPDVASAVMARIRQRGLHAFTATATDDADRVYYSELPNPAMVWYRDQKVVFGDPGLRELDDPLAALDEPVVSFTLLAERAAMSGLAAEIQAELGDRVHLHLFENLYCPGWWELSIQDRHATKASAIATLRRSFGLESHRLVVFGDSTNDLEMFREADHAVAVENAVPELVALASEITARNDQDGVVRWIAAAQASGRV